jgi:hypothetical protein
MLRFIGVSQTDFRNEGFYDSSLSTAASAVVHNQKITSAKLPCIASNAQVSGNENLISNSV